MGTPTVNPVVGINCALCDDILWLANDTPYYVKVTFDDIDDCGFPAMPVPPNGEWILYQNPIFACQWILTTADYFIVWTNLALMTTLIASWVGDMNARYFNASWPAKCRRSFDNGNVACLVGVRIGKNGTGNVDIGF